jgi:hypothetical protein
MRRRFKLVLDAFLNIFCRYMFYGLILLPFQLRFQREAEISCPNYWATCSRQLREIGRLVAG